MLQSVKDSCDLHAMALDYSMSEQVENLSDVIAATAPKAQEFFEKNYITVGMRELLSQGLRRLAGRSEQAVFELKQAMGGGKTHSMIALGLLAKDPRLRAEIVPDIAQEAPFTEAKLVALNGRAVPDDAFIWGEIARQLGKPEAFSKFWREGPKAPIRARLDSTHRRRSHSHPPRRTAALLRLLRNAPSWRRQLSPSNHLRIVELTLCGS